LTKYVVLYHNDSDGLASAAAAYAVLGTKAVYHPVQYNQPVPDVTLDKDTILYIVDFSYPLKTLQDLTSKVKEIMVIDHHETAMKDLESFEFCVYNMELSGAELTWNYFHPGKPVPRMIQLVGDRDLWNFNYADSKPFEAGIRSSGRYGEVAYWAQLLEDEGALDIILANGWTQLKPINEYINSFVKSDKYTIVKFRGHRCAVYNTTYLISDLAEGIYSSTDQIADMTMSYFITSDLKMVFSLRASKHNDVDVGSIAKSLGGGGHRKASGVAMSITDGAAFLKGLVET
jgi:oligoribonuclease NrnB/cAMP/cGMP phosphodiesterase (DHH superfamily)